MWLDIVTRKGQRDKPADLFAAAADAVAVVVVVVVCDGGATGVGTVFSLSEIQP